MIMPRRWDTIITRRSVPPFLFYMVALCVSVALNDAPGRVLQKWDSILTITED